MDFRKNGIEAFKGTFGELRGRSKAVIDKMGFLQFFGDASCWDDLDFPIVARTAQAGQPTPTTFVGNLTAPVSNPFVPMLQIHFKKDTLGSRGLWTK